MRLEMVIGMDIGIINAGKIGLSSNATLEKRRRRIVVDAGFHSDIDVEPHLFGTGCRRSQLYMYIYVIYMYGTNNVRIHNMHRRSKRRR